MTAIIEIGQFHSVSIRFFGLIKNYNFPEHEGSLKGEYHTLLEKSKFKKACSPISGTHV